MLHTTIALVIMAVLVITITITNVEAESFFVMPSPQKQLASGTAVEDVVCNTGLTLMFRFTSDSSVCVKPSTAVKLLERGWGQILKESAMMDEKRQKMMDEQKMIEEQQMMANESIYDPQINPTDFTTKITNPYMNLPLRTTFVYEENTDEGLERNEIFITGDTKTVMGVETLVYWDRVWVDGQLIEDTRDWLAQDKEGNVWYFGEEVDNYANGQLINHDGSWEAGVDGAKPGYWMKADPQVGESYREEYYKGKAEDMAEVISLDESVTVPYGEFSDCLKTKNWTPLEPDVVEYNYYCPQIGNVVLEEVPADNEKVELIDVMYDQPASITPAPEPAPEPSPEPTPEPSNITLEEAKQIALEAVPGVVTDVDTEVFQGKSVYAIEIRANNGIETDVFVDMKTGEVLGMET